MRKISTQPSQSNAEFEFGVNSNPHLGFDNSIALDLECYTPPESAEAYLGDTEMHAVFYFHREQDARWY